MLRHLICSFAVGLTVCSTSTADVPRKPTRESGKVRQIENLEEFLAGKSQKAVAKEFAEIVRIVRATGHPEIAESLRGSRLALLELAVAKPGEAIQSVRNQKAIDGIFLAVLKTERAAARDRDKARMVKWAAAKFARQLRLMNRSLSRTPSDSTTDIIISELPNDDPSDSNDELSETNNSSGFLQYSGSSGSVVVTSTLFWIDPFLSGELRLPGSSQIVPHGGLTPATGVDGSTGQLMFSLPSITPPPVPEPTSEPTPIP